MRKINGFLTQFCKIAIMLMVPFMTGIIFLQVIMRYLFLAPFSWAEELARYLLIWISCLGAAYAVRQGLHISVLFIKNKLPQHMRSLATLVVHCSVIGFFLMCVFQGFKLAFSQWIELTAALRMPMTFPVLAIPIGFGIMIMFSVELLIEDVRAMLAGRNTRKTT